MSWDKIWENVIKGTAVCGGVIAGWFGGFTPMMYVLLFFIATDYISGSLVAAMGKSKKTEGGGSWFRMR